MRKRASKVTVSPTQCKDGTWGITKSYPTARDRDGDIDYDTEVVVERGLTKSGAYAMCHTMALAGELTCLIPVRLDSNLKRIDDSDRD